MDDVTIKAMRILATAIRDTHVECKSKEIKAYPVCIPPRPTAGPTPVAVARLLLASLTAQFPDALNTEGVRELRRRIDRDFEAERRGATQAPFAFPGDAVDDIGAALVAAAAKEAHDTPPQSSSENATSARPIAAAAATTDTPSSSATPGAPAPKCTNTPAPST